MLKKNKKKVDKTPIMCYTIQKQGEDMQIPKKVKVAGHTYKVVWDTKRLCDEGLVGETDHNQDIIYMTTQFPGGQDRAESEIEETLIHEILHAVDVNYNNHTLEEKEVVRLATGLHQVFKDMKLLKNK